MARGGAAEAEAEPPAAGDPPPAGKGRPTPRRSQAEAASRRPLVGAARNRGRAREERRESWARTQEAYRTEDQRLLPIRDRGEARRHLRDLVDGRRNAGEYFLPAALVVLLLGVLPYAITVTISAVGMYTILGVVLLDSFLVFRRAKASVRERFGDRAAAERGLGTYAVARALQMRRMRRPYPQVKHGEKPR
jgi:hypothetical protein